MLRSLVPRIFRPACQSRLLSTQLAASGSQPVPPPPAQTSQPSHAQPEQSLPYRVRRNTRGSIPVYTDIRNGGTRYLVLIRNVEGSVDVRPVSLISPAFRSSVLT
ncbi:hypothetical protein ONZ51_g13415 [Trametes cubensis]|uniref:Large ribosomal subunit protein mL49 n=1 Tax=Trametes cubensis TaxID=1111947 RepID=A0AAD7TEF8_9APHY|nr:hypothetical protein ONZ51_g13415 [Trametes cubensis]